MLSPDPLSVSGVGSEKLHFQQVSRWCWHCLSGNCTLRNTILDYWASLVAQMVKDLPHAGDLGLISGLGRSPGEGNGNPFQYSCLGNPTVRGACRATVHGVAESWLSNWTCVLLEARFFLLKDFLLHKGLRWQHFCCLSFVDWRFLVPGLSWRHGFRSCTCLVLSL